MATGVYDDEKQDQVAGSHDDLGVSAEQKKQEVSSLEDSFNAPSAEKPTKEEEAVGGGKQDQSAVPDLFSQNPAKKISGGFSIGKIKITKKQGGIAGGLIAIIASMFIGLSTLGPLQFIHFAQMLDAFHFSDQEYNGNSRIKKLIIYAKSNKAQDTRLGFIANAQASKIDKKLAANGWAIESKNAGNFDGFSYDPTSGDSPVKDSEAAKHNQELKAALEKEGVKNIKIETVTKTVNGKKVSKSVLRIPPDGMKYWSNRALIKTIYSGNRDVGKTVGAFEKRILIKRAGITFNPVTKLDNKIKGTVAERMKKWHEDLSKKVTGQTPVEIKAGAGDLPDNATDEQKKANADQAATAEETNTIADEAKSGKLTAGKLAGGGAAAVGFLCIVKTVADESSKASELNRIVPLVQTSSLILSAGSKYMAGDDVSLEVAQELSKNLSSKENGSFMNASTLQYEQGKTGGKRLPAELDPNGGQNLVSEMLAKFPGLDQACSILNNTIVTIVLSAAAPVASALQYAFMETAGKVLFEKLINYFVTPVVDTTLPKYAGGIFGETANVGARIMSNETAASMGGRRLSAAEETNLNQLVKADTNERDKTESIAEKYLSPKNFDTPVARVIDSVDTSNVGETVARLPGVLFSTLLSPINKRANAGITPDQAYYGIQKVGFTPSSLDAIENPYTNAEDAKSILQNTGDKYINLLKECNKVEVIGVASGETLDFTSVGGTADAPAVMGNYKDAPAECNSDTDPDFLKVRVAVYDTITMKSLSCLEFDDGESCQQIMPTNPINDSTTPTPGLTGSAINTKFGPFVFPIQTSKEAIMNNKPDHWCYTQKDVTCHGTEDFKYFASDIFIKEGVPIVSATDGKVVKVDQTHDNKAGTAKEALITIKGNDCDDSGTKLTCIGEGTVFWYGHLKPNSATVKVGDLVKAGQQIAVSGGNAQGDGISHLHFDASNRKNAFREACARETPDLCAAVGFINIQPELYAAFNAIGTNQSGGASGWQWPLAKDLRQGNCWNVKVGSLGYHAGMDINTNDISTNNPALAAHDGTVVSIGFDANAGNYLTIKSTDGIFYSYEHLTKHLVTNGQQVRAGDAVGIVGKTGRVFAASNGHLHFVTAKTNTLGSYSQSPQSNTVDPMDYLPQNAPNNYSCLK